jgi:hypothetical protein
MVMLKTPFNPRFGKSIQFILIRIIGKMYKKYPVKKYVAQRVFEGSIESSSFIFSYNTTDFKYFGP